MEMFHYILLLLPVVVLFVGRMMFGRRSGATSVPSRGRLIINLSAEMMGTFFLVFIGCGALMVHRMGFEMVSVFMVILAFGGTVMVMIALFGSVSGAHVNPAVSTAFYLKGEMRTTDYFLYVLSQVVGAFLASGVHGIILCCSDAMSMNALKSLGEPLLGEIHFTGGMFFEGVLTFLLVFVILRLAASKTSPIMMGLVVGVTLLICGVVGVAFTGASLNPARAVAPMVMSGFVAYDGEVLVSLIVYLVVPFLSSFLAVWASMGYENGLKNTSE